ncbi:MAG: 50S ribosomal protein L21 [Candidatus Spechtbacteria bacterium]|nr:50S ribosomal protein L21 [Candidatus Spechtbacteria bacterium]
MFAVIKTGGKQYIVEPGKRVRVEKLEFQKDAEVIFDSVLVYDSPKGVVVGQPFVPGVFVRGKVTEQGKADKVIVFKYTSKKRTRKLKGHRQPFTEVEVVAIEEGAVPKTVVKSEKVVTAKLQTRTRAKTVKK